MSDKSVAQKLLIRENYKTLLINEPQYYKSMLGALPQNVTLLTKSTEPVDFMQVFVASRKELEAQLPKFKVLLKPKGLLWVSYPKGTSKIKADINRDSIREYGQSIVLEAVALVALDDTWSALRLKIV